MPLARCPDCDQLVGITPTNRPKMPNFSASWWRFAEHERPPSVSYPERWDVVFERCDGSGKLV